jgi:RHS repeat-associated protein
MTPASSRLAQALLGCVVALALCSLTQAQVLPATFDTNAPKPPVQQLDGVGDGQAELTVVEAAMNRMNAARAIEALDESALGDSYDPASGNLRFFRTDVLLRGTGPDIAISRSLDVGKTSSAWWHRGRPFGDWELELPRLTTRTPHPALSPKWQVVGASPNARCASFGRARDVVINGYNHPASEWWEGVQLVIPGEGSQEVMTRAPENTLTPAAFTSPSIASWPLVTSKHWMLGCLGTTANGEPGDAFFAVSPDGTKYWFNYLTTGDYDWYSLPQVVGFALYRYEAQLLPTRIEDRYGNALVFTYDAGRLTDIVAGDGRAVKLTWATVNNISYITKVTEQPLDPKERVWNYAYQTPPLGRTLHTVTQPDTRQWVYQFGNLTKYCFQWQPDAQSPWCDPSYAGYSTGTVTAPSGLVGTFRILGGINYRDISQTTPDCFHEAPGATEEYFSVGMVDKVLSGPGINQTWTTSPTPTCPVTGCSSPLPYAKLSFLNHPSGKTTLFHVRWSWCTADFGEVLRTDIDPVFNGSTTLVSAKQTVTTQRALPNAGPFPARIGLVPQTYANRKALEYLRPAIKRDIVQDGVTFTREVQSLDTYGRPLQVKRHSSLGHERVETTVYHDNLAKWVMGQVASITEQSTSAVMFAQAFDATTADVLTQSKFGKLMQSLTYNTDGTVATTSDGAGNSTQYLSYKRGVPQTVTGPDLLSSSAVVNNLGQVDSTTDALGNATSYGYDAMGRLNSTTYPTGDSVAWTAETSVFEPVASAEYGLGAGHWRHRTTRGNYRKDVFFDARWNPVVEREYDNANPNATDRFVVRNFDAEGKPTFESYPLDALTTWSTVTKGRHTVYDRLGRVFQSRQTSDELGDMVTQTDYLTGFQVRVTDPKNNPVTTTTYRVLDEPTTEAPLVTTAPEGLTTTTVRDVFGKPTSITRSGPWTGATCGVQSNTLCVVRSFVYDAHQRLCKTVQPESDATVVDYDDAGNLKWRATGLALPLLTECNRDTTSAPESVRTVYSYDLLNRVTGINYPGTADDISYTFYDDGALWTATSGTSVWTYEYNKRRMLEKETLALPERTYAFDWYYNAHGHLAGVYYPGNFHIDHDPNILGQPRKASTFAHTASYLPNGGVDGYTLGNGVVRDVTPNSQGLTGRIRDTFGATVLLDQSLVYDKNGNLAQITDATSGGLDTRTLAYDGRDRLTGVSGAPGAPASDEVYSYDPLDNVRRALYGGRDRRYHYNTKNQLQRIASPSGVDEFSYLWNVNGEVSSRTNYFATQPSTLPPNTIFRHGFEEPTGTVTEGFGFDTAGRLVGFTSATHAYDAHKRRVRTVVPMWGTRFEVYARDGRLLLAEDTTTQQRTDYVWMGGTLVAKRLLNTSTSAATPQYLHNDYRDSTVVESNTSGAMALRKRMAPFGEPVDGEYHNGKGYAGHAYEELGRLVYMQLRFYDPAALRFLSTDPEPSTPLSFNRYWYARNNPYTYVDPDGAESPCVTLGSGCLTTTPEEAVAYEAIFNGMADGLEFVDREFLTPLGPFGGAAAGKMVVLPAARLIRPVAGTAAAGARVEQVAAGTLVAARSMAAGAQGFGQLAHAAQHGIQGYAKLTKALQGTGLQAHHLIEQRFASILGTNVRTMSSVALTPAEHQAFTNAWRALIPYGPAGTGTATRESIEAAARIIYADYPAIRQALGL